MRQINNTLEIAYAEHRWDSLDINGERRDVGTIDGRRVVLACGIGNPEAFIGNVLGHGAKIVERVVMGDHHLWSSADAARLERACSDAGPGTALVTTAKDWVKLCEHFPREASRFDVIVPELSIAMTQEESLVALVADAAGRARRPGE